MRKASASRKSICHTSHRSVGSTSRLRAPTIGKAPINPGEGSNPSAETPSNSYGPKSLEEFDFAQAPKIPAAKIRELAEGGYKVGQSGVSNSRRILRVVHLQATRLTQQAELNRVSQVVVFPPPFVDAPDVFFRKKPTADHLAVRQSQESLTLLFGDLVGG
jgi:hypothetical protein